MNSEQLLKRLRFARERVRMAAAARARAYRRTPTTATAEREHAKADRYLGQADAAFDEVEEVLAAREALKHSEGKVS